MAVGDRDRPRRAWAAAVAAAGRRAGVALPDPLATAADGLRRKLLEWAVAEVAPGRLVPWLPVAFGCGIAGYFTAEHEPAWWAAAFSLPSPRDAAPWALLWRLPSPRWPLASPSPR